jgi:hypothetical protein
MDTPSLLPLIWHEIPSCWYHSLFAGAGDLISSVKPPFECSGTENDLFVEFIITEHVPSLISKPSGSVGVRIAAKPLLSKSSTEKLASAGNAVPGGNTCFDIESIACFWEEINSKLSEITYTTWPFLTIESACCRLTHCRTFREFIFLSTNNSKTIRLISHPDVGGVPNLSPKINIVEWVFGVASFVSPIDKVMTAVADIMGFLRGSFFAICLAVCMFSLTAYPVNAAPVPISTSMPSIKNLQPHLAFNFCLLKSSAFRNQSFSAPFSIQSPKRTSMPPILAAAENTTALVNQDAEAGCEISPKMQNIIVLITLIPYLIFGATAIAILFRHERRNRK